MVLLTDPWPDSAQTKIEHASAAELCTLKLMRTLHEPGHITLPAVHISIRGMNDLKSAEIDFNEAMNIDPKDPTIYFNRGNVYLNNDPPEFEKAHADYDTAISIASNNAKLWHSKGLAY